VNGDQNSLFNVYVHDRQTATTTRESVPFDSVVPNGSVANGPSNVPAISGDGRYVTFRSTASNLVSGDTNGIGDISSTTARSLLRPACQSPATALSPTVTSASIPR